MLQYLSKDLDRLHISWLKLKHRPVNLGYHVVSMMIPAIVVDFLKQMNHSILHVPD